MSSLQLHRLVDQLAGVVDRPSDDHLLAAYVRDRDENAFAELVRRHGPMVLAVCRRVTGREQDAEDAFQATFLVLARKAARVRPRSAVGGWLHGVAVRTALKARTRSARFAASEIPAVPAPRTELPDAEACRLLDEEIDRLPEGLRLAVVLCELQDLPRREAAAQLGIPEGTLSSRLASARKRLATRLRSRGVSLGVGAVAGLLAGAAAPPVSARLLEAAIGVGTATAALGSSIVTLSEGVIRTMFLNKLKAVGVAVVMVVGGGGAWVAGVGMADEPVKEKTEPTQRLKVTVSGATLGDGAAGEAKKREARRKELLDLAEKPLAELAKALAGADDDLKHVALDAIAAKYATSEEAHKALIEALDHTHSDWLSHRIADLLGDGKAYTAHRRLRKLVTDHEFSRVICARAAAAKALAQLGERDAEVVTTLHEGVQSDDYWARLVANKGLTALAGKDLSAFDGYKIAEGEAIAGRWPSKPFDAIRHSEKRERRYRAIRLYCEWLKKDRPDVYKHLTGTF